MIKTPVDTEEALPEVMKDVLGYEFFTFEDGTPLELDPAYGEKFAQDVQTEGREIGLGCGATSQEIRGGHA